VAITDRPPASPHVPAFPASYYSCGDHTTPSFCYDVQPPFSAVDKASSVYLHDLGGGGTDGSRWVGDGGYYVGGGYTHFMQEHYTLGVQSW